VKKALSAVRLHTTIKLTLTEHPIPKGMRKKCDLFIYINMQKAMEGLLARHNDFELTCALDGILFYLSENRVILTTGKDGILESKYFSKVQDNKGEEYV
jgi:hypothetical protein